MQIQNLRPTLQRRQINRHLPIKPPRPQKCRVQRVRPIRRRNHNHALIRVKPIHLHQHRIQRLLIRMLPPHRTRARPLLPNRINLINEHNARRTLLRLRKYIPHPARTHAHKHLFKVAPAHRKEWHLRLPSNRLGKKRLTRPRRPHEQHPLRNAPTQLPEIIRRLQKLHNLLHLFLRLINPRHVRKRHMLLVLFPIQYLRTRLPKRKHPVLPANAPIKNPIEKRQESKEEQQLRHKRRKRTLMLFNLHLHLPRQQILHQLLILARYQIDAKRLALHRPLLIHLIGLQFARQIRLARIAVTMANNGCNNLSRVKRAVKFKLRQIAHFRPVGIHPIHRNERQRNEANHEPRTQ